MAAGMEIVKIAGQMRKLPKVIQHRFPRERAQALVRCAGVERIGRMRDDRADSVLCRKRTVRRKIRLIKRLRRAAARVAREELERIRTDGNGFFSHVQKPFRRGKVASNLLHRILLLFLSSAFSIPPRHALHQPCSRRTFFCRNSCRLCFYICSARKKRANI